MRRKLIAGNWKMNGSRATAATLAGELARRARAAAPLACDLVVCPPAPLLIPVQEAIRDSPVALGAQDCHPAANGAHTGDVSAAILKDVGCAFVIVGHSERRSDHGESDALVKAKAEAARAVGLTPIVCVGETAEERERGQTLARIEGQIAGSLPASGEAADLVVAYEPVWAIGTGRTATPEDAAEAHAHIRALLAGRLGRELGAAVRILYGGSVKPDNARALLAAGDVDGALVGGASLKADDFWAIAGSCP